MAQARAFPRLGCPGGSIAGPFPKSSEEKTMRIHVFFLSAAVALACWALPAHAQDQGRVSAGAVVWGHNTNLEVDLATDFDGSDETATERAKDWDAQGSGMGIRLNYAFPKLVGLFGEVGAAQATVRDRDVQATNQDVTSRGLDTGLYFGFGGRLGTELPEDGNLFWSAGAAFSSVSTSLDEGVDRSWQYDETAFKFDGKVGRWVHSIALYGGTRFVQYSGNLDDTDRTRIPGQQVRTVELKRDGGVDLLVGAQTKGRDISGFAELGLVGTFSATTGLAFQF